MGRKRQLLRVTSVLDFVESQWKEFWWRKVGFEAADKVSKESREFGTRVHKLVETWQRTSVLPADGPKPEYECAKAIVDYLVEHKVTHLFGTADKSVEVEVKDEKLGLIGHFDYAAAVDGQACIVDYKTSKNMRKSFPLQKAAYAKMANSQFGVDIDNGLTLRSHWDAEKQQVEFEPKYYTGLKTKYWRIFKSCLDVMKYFTRTEKAP